MPIGTRNTIQVGLEEIGRRFTVMSREVNVEVARGANDAGGQIRTIVRHALQDQMGVLKYKVAVDAVKSTPASPDHLRYEIWSSRGGLPIRDFLMQATAAGVQAHVWGVDKTFQRSFVSSVRGLPLARLGSARMPIRALFGPAPYKELLKGETLASWERAVPLLVEPLVLQRVMRLSPVT